MKRPRVLLADDHRMVAEGLKSLLAAEFDLVAVVEDGRAMVEAAMKLRPEVVVTRMSEEHGILDLAKTAWRPQVGELVRVVPNHVCIVVHLNDVIYGVRGDRVETSWAVDARGRAQPVVGGMAEVLPPIA